MGRNPCCCCSNIGLHKRRWMAEEDQLLSKYVAANGGRNWRSVPQGTGIQRCGRSCRFKWLNYLRTDIKKGNIEPDKEDHIIRLHARLRNRWSLIAKHLPGRSDNEIKNYWNNHLRKKLEHQETDHNASNPQPLEKNEKNHIKNKSEMKEKGHRPKAIRWTSSQKHTWNCDNLGAMGVCGGLDDKLVIESSSHDGRNELVKDGLDVSQPGFYSSILEDHSLDFLDEGMLEELSELLKEDA